MAETEGLKGLTEDQWNLVNARMKALDIKDDSALARKIGVKPQTVWKWRRGERTPGRDNIHRLLYALELSRVEFADPVAYKEAMARSLEAAPRAVPGENVAGVVKPVPREHSAWEELPVFDGIRAAGIMTGEEQWPEPEYMAEPPEDFKDEIGPNGIGMIVRGESMAGGLNTPIPDGTIIWFNPHVSTRKRGVVAAVVRETEDGTPRAVVKFHAGDNTLYSLPAPPGSQRVPFPVFEVVTMCEVIAVDPQPGRP